MTRRLLDFDVWLEIRSKEMTLLEISAALGSDPTPDLSLRRGDFAPLHEIYELNLWRLGSQLPGGASLEEHLSELLRLPVVIGLRESCDLLTSDTEIYVVVGVFPVDGTFVATIQLPPAVLRELGDLDLEIVMSVYP